MKRAVSAEGKVRPDLATHENGVPAKVVDLYYWLSVVLQEYRERLAQVKSLVG